MVDQRTNDESKFWHISPAAEAIFNYLENNEEIKGSPWGFDRGFISKDFSISSAYFSCASVSGWGKDKLHIAAKKNVSGTWELSHTIERDQ